MGASSGRVACGHRTRHHLHGKERRLRGNVSKPRLPSPAGSARPPLGPLSTPHSGPETRVNSIAFAAYSSRFNFLQRHSGRGRGNLLPPERRDQARTRVGYPSRAWARIFATPSMSPARSAAMTNTPHTSTPEKPQRSMSQLQRTGPVLSIGIRFENCRISSRDHEFSALRTERSSFGTYVTPSLRARLRLGESLPMVEKLLGHTQVQTIAPYAHLVRDTVRASASPVGDSIGDALVSDEPVGPAVTPVGPIGKSSRSARRRRSPRPERRPNWRPTSRSSRAMP